MYVPCAPVVMVVWNLATASDSIPPLIVVDTSNFHPCSVENLDDNVSVYFLMNVNLTGVEPELTVESGKRYNKLLST